MFKANRVGTPWITTTEIASSTRVGWLAANGAFTGTIRGNVVNASPSLDFGSSALYWTGSEAVAANNSFSIGQQFTVTQPIEGDTVGIEVMGGLLFAVPPEAVLQPIFFRVTTAGAAVLDAVDQNTYFTYLDALDVTEPATTIGTVVNRSIRYRTQVIAKGASAAVIPGTYFHGVNCIAQAAGFNLTALIGRFAVRQLNDQQNVGYRDTRR